MTILIIFLFLASIVGIMLYAARAIQERIDNLEIIALHNKNQLVKLTINQASNHMAIMTLRKRLEDEKVI